MDTLPLASVLALPRDILSRKNSNSIPWIPFFESLSALFITRLASTLPMPVFCEETESVSGCTATL